MLVAMLKSRTETRDRSLFCLVCGDNICELQKSQESFSSHLRVREAMMAARPETSLPLLPPPLAPHLHVQVGEVSKELEFDLDDLDEDEDGEGAGQSRGEEGAVQP